VERLDSPIAIGSIASIVDNDSSAVRYPGDDAAGARLALR